MLLFCCCYFEPWLRFISFCCVYSDKKHDYSVVLGGLNLVQKEPTDQTVLVEDTIIHEKYKETPDVVYNDIGVYCRHLFAQINRVLILSPLMFL